MIPAESIVHDDVPPAPRPEPRSVHVIAAGLVLALIGWAGLAWLVLNTLPTVPNRWLFFALLQLALMGTALPVVQFLHQRFAPRSGTADNPVVLIRQAAWVGLFGTVCTWLRIPRLLSIPLVLIILVALIAIEFFFRLRERMEWRPE